ncbi:MAG: TIGR04084 family radical SAM/SPASM domain-containing protein [archaeon]
MHYHIILTERCNLQCKYCYEKSLQEFDNGLQNKFNFNFDEPCVSQIKIQKLKSFISKDPQATIIFYGGEPLLQIDKIKEIIDNINVPYRMQTNGQLLHLLEPKYLNKITKILISIDGNETITDKYRGKETYKKIIDNINLIKQNGYKGEIVARMTVAQDNPEIFENVQDILSTKLFDSVHWQLDAGFYKEDFQEKRITNFFQEYNNSISKLINWWMSEIQNGRIHKLYPFIAITESILNNTSTKLRCGAGHSGYAITTSGNIQACPIMNSIEDFKAGDLDTNPTNIKKFEINECKNCSHLKLCGGRCLYWRKATLWPIKGDDIICNSIKHLIDKLKLKTPKIKKAISEGKISKDNFNYEKYFGPEIIP